MKYLFLFTISPVQSFIAQARKTKDLFSGSKILSDLIGYAIEEAKPTELIFPMKGLDSYPNRFIAVIEKDNDTDMKKFGDDLKIKVIEKFEEYSSLSIMNTNVVVNKLPNNFRDQIKKHLSIQWVAIPYQSEKYNEQFLEIESLLGAVKNVREFEQLEEIGRKCSICGERNAIFYYGKKHNYYQSDAVEVKNLELQDGEGLCAVCYTKRFYQDKHFPSTAEIALLDSVKKLRPKEIFEDYKNLFKGYFDYQLLFEENLTKKYFEKQSIPQNLLEQAKNKFIGIKKAFKENNMKFTPYFSVIMFDGDSMGKWLSGAYLNSTVELKKFHNKLTESLGKFAEETKNIVTSDKGKVVYAGGEDFLAFINLNYLFDILNQLRKKFDEIVNQGISEFIIENVNLTFSAGIAITHYKMPLSEVLSWVRKLEKDAKNIDDDKNAFAIAVMKHSGEINKTILKWGDKNNENLDAIAQLTYDLANEIFSKSFINKLSSEFYNINPSDEILKTELKRLLARSSKFSKRENETKEDFEKRKKLKIDETTEKIISLYKLDTENLFTALFISEFISRHLNGGKNEN
ncbi:MAG: type III-B CRISPR-associated protein Cas10/Cmr2 [Melioribacteraceae bacterium]|nr:type III-B CRISPR-associated protein Cas10/Cmr2 [Melioribacteraceae bacterium]